MNTKNTVDIQVRYQNAQKILKGFVSQKLAKNTVVYPTWIGDRDCFWYVKDLDEGLKEFRLVKPNDVSNTPAFDHEKLANALSRATGEKIEALNLPFSDIELNFDMDIVQFTAFDKAWSYSDEKNECSERPSVPGDLELPSPDGKYLVFRKDYNLWLRFLSSGEERQLTKDGEEDNAYGAPSTAWGFPHYDSLQVLWSPDSKRLLVTQRDKRHVKDLPVLQYAPQEGSTRPRVSYHKIAYPGDKDVEQLKLFTIDINSGSIRDIDYGRIPVTRNSLDFFVSKLGWWHKDSRLAYFVDIDRYYKSVRVVELDSATGKTRILIEETSETQVNLMANGDMWPSYLALSETNELLWYSDRTGWAHLYLYDLDSGKLKHAVTEGQWLVRDVITVNAQRREAFVQTAGRVSGRNPYYRDVVKISIDTGCMSTLVSSDHDYFTSAFTDMEGYSFVGSGRQCEQRRGTSPSGNYTLVTRSRADELAISFLVDTDGKELMTVETAELLDVPKGWTLPEPVKATGADGQTDIYGVIYRPSHFSPDKTYPVISDLYNTPDFPWAPIGCMGNNIFGGYGFFMASALAELGFIVVQLDGRGGSFRDRAFKGAGYGNLELPIMLEDHVAGLKQLGGRYKEMDTNRVAVNECQGGPGVLLGLIEYPDLYKVGVTNTPHDSRFMSCSMWADMFEGKDSTKRSRLEEKIGRLEGKLLMSHGMVDLCVPPASVFRVVEALRKSNKEFDLILLPEHGHSVSSYLTRRSWDYLVRHMLCEEPPKNFDLSGVFGAE